MEEQHAPSRPSADLGKLATLVNLPEPPQSVLFVNERVGEGGPIGPTDRALVAVLRFDRESLDRLKSRAQRLKPEERAPRLRERSSWFPEPLLSAVKPCGPLWCVDGERYSGDAFLKGGFVTADFIVPDGLDIVILRSGT
jgi:hypothetical protein